MINIYVCEDNEVHRKRIEEIIRNVLMIEALDMELLLSTDNPYAVLDHVRKNPVVGLYFLDIDLKVQMNGLGLAQELRKIDPRGFIIFITSHSEMSFLTFQYKVEAMDFIIKDDYEGVYTRVHDCIMNVYERYSSTNNVIQKHYTIKTNDRKMVVAYNDILFFETSTNIHKIILHAQNRQIEFYGKLKDIEGQVDDSFYRCHRSYLVNKKQIKEIDYQDGIILMVNGETCLGSTRLLKGLKL